MGSRADANSDVLDGFEEEDMVGWLGMGWDRVVTVGAVAGCLVSLLVRVRGLLLLLRYLFGTAFS